MNKYSFLDKDHLKQLLLPHSAEDVKVFSVEPYAIDNSASILVTLTAQETDRRIGHFGLNLNWALKGKDRQDRLVLKVKPPGHEIASMLGGLAVASDTKLGAVYEQHVATTGFVNTHLREIEVYKELSHAIQPGFFGYQLDQNQDRYEILMEDLSDCALLNSVMQVELWSDDHLHRALSDMANWHVFAKANLHVLNFSAWQDTDHKKYWIQEAPLWHMLLVSGKRNFPAFYANGVYEALSAGLNQVEELADQFWVIPKTLVHNDANPRNACFRSDGRFCLYDWELSCKHVPAYDIIELLSFVLEENRFNKVDHFLNYYRKQLVIEWPIWEDDKLWNQSLQLAWYSFGWLRLGLYTMAHAVAPYPFLPRVHRAYAAIGAHLGILN